MTEPQEKPRVRLFLALDLPATVREGIARWGERELRDPALRAVAAENLHVTLAFLGHREEAQVEPISAALAACSTAALRMELGQPEARPARKRARVFALPVRSEGAQVLQADLVARLGAAGLYEAEKRPFWPHVTVARVRTEKRRPLAIAKPPGTLPEALLAPFFAVRIALYRSELQPRGARYVPLAHVELSASGRQ